MMVSLIVCILYAPNMGGDIFMKMMGGFHTSTDLVTIIKSQVCYAYLYILWFLIITTLKELILMFWL